MYSKEEGKTQNPENLGGVGKIQRASPRERGMM